MFSREGVGARGLLPGALGLGIGALAAYATQHFQKPQDYPQRSNPPQIKPFKLSLSRRRPRLLDPHGMQVAPRPSRGDKKDAATGDTA